MDDKLMELRRLKAQRSRQRELRDLEERKLLDTLQETDRRLRGSSPPGKVRSKLQLSKNRDIRDMQIQYERDRERKLYGHPQRDYGKTDLPKYNPNADPKVQQLAETHGRHMQHLQDRNRELERQREEIRRRLEELGKRPLKDDDSMNALLQELRDQEARNQKMLEELRRQLLAARYVPPAPGVAPPPEKGKPFIYPVYYGNSLVAEITAMRQAYLQNGGNDPDILHQLAQMQAEAQAIDDSLKNKSNQPKTKKELDSLHSLELENERLMRQLQLLQEQNLAAKHRRKGDREGRQSRLIGNTRTIIEENSKQNTRKILSIDPNSVTPVNPLDINHDELNKEDEGLKKQRDKIVKQMLKDMNFVSPRRAYLHHFDPLKQRIDKDVGNTAFKVKAHLFESDEEEEEEEEEVFIDKTRIKRATLLNEPTKDVVTGVHTKPAEELNYTMVKDDSSSYMPYHRNHFASRGLKRVDKELRDEYLRTSKANLRPYDVDRLDLLSVIDENSRANTAVSENEFIPISQRSKNDNLTSRLGEQCRPQLIVEATPTS